MGEFNSINVTCIDDFELNNSKVTHVDGKANTWAPYKEGVY